MPMKKPSLTAILETLPSTIVGRLFSVFPETRKSGKRLSEPLHLFRRNGAGNAFVWVREEDGEFHFSVGDLGLEATNARYSVTAWDDIQTHLAHLMDDGFNPCHPDQMAQIQFVYRISPDESPETAFERREAIATRLGHLFTNTGQGYFHAANTNDGLMELTFLVVDFDMARSTATADLADSIFDDYMVIRRAAAAPAQIGAGDSTLTNGFTPALS